MKPSISRPHVDLDPIDDLPADACFAIVRSADDLVILHRTAQQRGVQ